MRAALVVALLLASCAITPERTRLPDLQGVPASFEMSGRLAVRQGQRSDIAKLRWTHAGAHDEWIISSPIGNEVARIDADASQAVLRRAGAESETAPDFSSLTERILGVALDPATLAGWLHGAGSTLTTEGWTVTLDEKQRAGSVDIARRITASRGDVSVRLVVDEYRALDR